MEYKCMNCEITFETTIMSEPTIGYADVKHCPNCGSDNLKDND